MSYILNIESSTTNCSISLANNGKLISIREFNEKNYSHSTKLHSFIEEVLKNSNISVNKLSAIAVSSGPGSYTGLRIGVSAAKGLCYALQVPLISVPTLKVLARQINIKGKYLIIPVLDARRDEVYSAVYNSKYELVRNIFPEIIDSESFIELAKENKLYFIGNGQEKCERLIRKNSNLIFSNYDTFPSSKEMVLISYEKFKKSKFEDVAYFEPYYLKKFKAG
ncbi:tRNA (adenosine(37)-N6)-threonylcarbamoyltransferase complex dimerization subunit type 1 TsaB [Flavobacteriaceae bacterium]|nr:tRNA (adenosine(37)-N6)-threonylcarbamoyltransferase complex dimerization subunit type 1 TsaB [Flavobacteriaceae bacterium]